MGGPKVRNGLKALSPSADAPQWQATTAHMGFPFGAVKNAAIVLSSSGHAWANSR
jgi:hypothetical protein